MFYLKQSTASQSVLLGPFVDDTDRATAESGLTIANTDIRLSKNGGNMAAKNSGGGTHDENGWYSITLDATDTDTVGRLQVSCKVAGALAVWAEFQVLEEAIYDALIAASAAGFDSNQRVDVGSWLGTAVTLSSTTNKPEVDVNSVSDDATAANNLELQYDGTGLTGDTFPAPQSQVASIGATSGGSLNFEATADNTTGAIKSVSFVGVETSGTFASTEAEDGTYHNIDDTTNQIDIIYQFDVGGSRLATEVVFKGYLDGANDTMNIQAYDFVGSDWETRAVLTGQSGTTNLSQAVTLLSKHTGTGSDVGLVLIRIQETGQTNPSLYVDELLVAAVSSTLSVGYEDGSVWLDTNASNTNTEDFVDGVADNPVSTIAAALTIAASVGL